MKKPKQAKRQCQVCGSEAKAGVNRFSKIDPKDPVVLAVNLILYRKTPRMRKHQLKTSNRVRVCEPCLIRIAASQGQLTIDAEIFALALIARLGEAYSSCVEQENLSLIKRPTGKSVEEHL